jgi:hypothetical protein
MFIADSVLFLIGAVLFTVVGSLVVFRSEDKHLIACLRSDIRHLGGELQRLNHLDLKWDDACAEMWNQAEQKCEEEWRDECERLSRLATALSADLEGTEAALTASLQQYDALAQAHKDMADFYGVIRVAD